jgi:alkylated DNA repair dioxygenase AlkB
MLLDLENKKKIKIKDGELYYDRFFFSNIEANKYFNLLKKEIQWQQDDIKIFGKIYPQPRLTALYANNNKSYSYSNIKMQPITFTPTLFDIKSKIEKRLNSQFTSCLLNLYRNGQDSNGWHADNEKELGLNPVIASLSLGAERVFHMKHRNDKKEKLKINLTNGSLLVMRGKTQHHWLHQIPKTRKKVEERINLTFRIIK